MEDDESAPAPAPAPEPPVPEIPDEARGIGALLHEIDAETYRHVREMLWPIREYVNSHSSGPEINGIGSTLDKLQKSIEDAVRASVRRRRIAALLEAIKSGGKGALA